MTVEGSSPATDASIADPNAGPVIIRRNRPGTRAEDFSSWPEEKFEEMDSTLAVQQYIQQTIRRDVSDVNMILTAPETQDEGCGSTSTSGSSPWSSTGWQWLCNRSVSRRPVRR